MKFFDNRKRHAGRGNRGPLFPASVRLHVSIVFAALAGTCCSGVAQRPVDTPRSGLINWAGAAFNSATGKGYVVDGDGSGVWVTDDRTGATRLVKVGDHPVSIAVDSQNGRAYVVNAGEGTVSVLEGKSDAVVTTVEVGDHPYSIASDSAAGKIYVTRTYSRQVMVIDSATNQVGTVEAGSPDLVAIDQKSHTVYLLSYEMGDLAIMNGTTHAITRTSVGMHAWGMAVHQETGAVYIAKPGDGKIAVIQRGSMDPVYIEIGGTPCAVAVNERTHTVFVADYSENAVRVIHGENKRVVAKIPVGDRPQALAVDADHNRIFVANTSGMSVSVIDGIADKVIRTDSIDGFPYALAANPTERTIHVATLGRSKSVSLGDR